MQRFDWNSSSFANFSEKSEKDQAPSSSEQVHSTERTSSWTELELEQEPQPLWQHQR